MPTRILSCCILAFMLLGSAIALQRQNTSAATGPNPDDPHVLEHPQIGRSARSAWEQGVTHRPPPHIEVIGLTKRFGDVQALDSVSLDVKSRRFHALIGENGAGKSTLAK